MNKQTSLTKRLFRTFLLGFVTLSGQLFAQNINNYVFSTNQTSSLNMDLNANPIDMSVGTTTLIGPLVRNGSGSGLVNFPNNFDCWVMGTKATSFSVSSHGWLGLNVALSNNNSWLSGPSELKIAPLLMTSSPAGSIQTMGTSSSGKIHYKLIGVAPNRTLVVEYQNMTIGTPISIINLVGATFQARIYEANGIIEFIYSPVTVSNASGNFFGNIGFSTSASNYISINPTNQTASTTTSTNISFTPGSFAPLSGGGTPNTRRAYIFTPNPITSPTFSGFSPVTPTSVRLNWVNNSIAPNIPINTEIYSSLNGIDWSLEAIVAPTVSTYQLTSLIPQQTYFFRIVAIKESRSSPLIMNTTTPPITLARSNTPGGSWKNPATWLNGAIPNAGDSVIITNGSSVTIDTNAVCYKLQIGEGISGNLTYDPSISRTLTVAESVVINNGASFTAGSGVIGTHQLNIGTSANSRNSGSLTNNGILDLFTTAQVMLNLAGNLTGSISGNGTITDFRNITVNKGNSNTNRPLLDINIPFTVQGGNTLGLISTHTAGVVRINGNFTQANPIYTTASYTIPLNGGFILNNPNFTVSSTNGGPLCNGLLQISQGVFNVSQASNQVFGFGTGAIFTVEGGTVNAAAGIASANAITFNFTNGNINIATVGNSINGSPSFGFTNANSFVNWSGGTLNLVQRATGTTTLDYWMGPFNTGNATITGGTLNIGAVGTINNFDFRLRGDAPTVIIDTAINNKSVTLAAQLNVMKKLILPQGSRLTLSGSTLRFAGDSIRSNGIIDGRISGSTMLFASTLSNQIYSGTGTDTIISLVNRNTFGGVLFNKNVVTYNVNFFSPTRFFNSNMIRLGNGLNQQVSIQFGESGFTSSVLGSGFDTMPIFNLGTGIYTVTYAQEASSRRTGMEIPLSRTITNLVINNSNGVLLSGGNLILTGTLSLTAGILTSADTASLYVVNAAETAVQVGSSSSYIKGVLIRRLPASLTTSNTYSFPIGSSGYSLIQLLNTRTNAGGFVDIRMQIQDGFTGGTPDGTSVNTMNPKYISVNIIAGSVNIDSTTLRYTQNGLIPTQRLAYSNSLTGIYQAISGSPTASSLTSSHSLIGSTALQGFFSLAEFIIPLSGNYLIGASKTNPNYTSLTSFVNSLTGRQIQGNVTLLLDADYTSSSETFPITLPRFYSNNPNWTITIKPNNGVNATISGNSSSSIIRINAASNYVIDGSNNNSSSRNLTVQNLNTAINTASIWISSLGAGFGSSNNVIQNTKISCGVDQKTSSSFTYGVFSGGSTISTTTGGNDNDSNLFYNNEITKAAVGILSLGGGTANTNIRNRIESNLIGASEFGPDQIGSCGILVKDEQNIVIDNNEIKFIGNLLSHTSSAWAQVGISAGGGPYFASGAINMARITRNKIHDIVHEKGANVIGIILSGITGVNNTGNVIANNDLYALRSNLSSGYQLTGIGLTGSRKDSVMFNTINLEGDLDPAGTTAATSSAFGLNIYDQQVTNPLIQNNIISINVNSNTNSLPHAAINIPTGFSWGNGFSNNNLLYSPNSNTQMRTGSIGGTSGAFYLTLNDWQTATGQDALSLSQNPLLSRPFISIPDLASPAIAAGSSIAGYTKDLLDSNRSNPPSIGAYEKPIDLKLPAISFTNLTYDTSLTIRNLSAFATITDTSGINNTSGLRPRIYFKKIQDANVFGTNNNSTNGWKWVEATNNSSPYSFGINYNLLFTPATIGDTIQYFVVAQDNAPTPNVGSWPSHGFEASLVNNIISGPSVPLFYKVVGTPLVGNYFVGGSQNFPTISSAMLAAFDRGVSNSVNFILTDSIYNVSTGEQFPIEVRPILGASAINQVTLRPNNGVMAVIRDSINNPLFNLNGVNYFNIDGIQTSSGLAKQLTVSNTHVGTNAAAVRFINDASNNRLESAIFLGANAPTNGNAGVIVFGNGLLTGNDKNNINNCEIGNASAFNRPSTLIYSAGSTDLLTKFNDSNNVTNCFLYNYSNPTSEFNAIKMITGNNAWGISDNHIYQTTPVTTTALHYVFNLSNSHNRTSLNNMKILRNFIGGSAPFCSGVPWTLNSSAGRLTSLFNMGSNQVNDIKGNKFCNFLYNSSSTGVAWNAITSQVGRLNIDSNIFGSAIGRDSIVLTSGGFAVIVSLNASDTDVVNIRRNQFGSIRTTSHLQLISCGSNQSFASFNIAENIFGNLLDSNIIISSNDTSISSRFYGIYSSNNSSTTTNVRDNIFRNITSNNNANATNALSAFSAIYIISGIQTVTGNQIYNLRNRGLRQPTSIVESGLVGIYSLFANTNSYFRKNQIYNLASTSTGASTMSVSGIMLQGTIKALVENNFIHTLTTAGSGTTCSIYGILISGTLTQNVESTRIINNIIRLGIDSTGSSLSTTPTIHGIRKLGENPNLSLLFNTVYIGGSLVQSGLSNTFAFSRTASGTDSIMNNIFVNLRSNSTTTGGTHYTIGLNSMDGLTSNGNLFYNDTNANGDMLAQIGTTNYLSLTNFRNSFATDANSIFANPNFLSPASASSLVDLRINPVLPSPTERAGISIPSVINDFDTQTRSSLTPTDIGADAGSFIPFDISPPLISYTPFIRDTVSSSRILTGQVNISDPFGVNVNSFKPRIYYKKRTDANVFLGNTSASNGWKFVEALNNASPFNFVIDYTILNGGGITVGDTIQYFVVAQDLNGNVTTTPLSGLSALSTTNILVAPTNPNAYAISDKPMKGLFLVGSGQTSPNFTSLTQAVNTVNLRGIADTVILELKDSFYSIQETFPITINEIIGASASKRLIIKPGNGVTAFIGNTLSPTLIILNGADYVTIDGSNNGTNSRNLTIRRFGISSGPLGAMIWGQTTTDNNPATNNTIQNVVIGGNSTSGIQIGIGFGSSTIGIPSFGAGNNNNTITNCDIRSANYGIYLGGRSLAEKDKNNIVSFNTMNATSPDNIKMMGILATFQDSLLIENNIIRNIRLPSSSNNAFGISLGCTSVTNYTPTGFEVTNAVVRNNTIGQLTPISGLGSEISALGICVLSATTGINSIQNNLIADVKSNVYPNALVAGIYAGGGVGSTTRIFHNTITLNGSVSSGSPNRFAIAIGGGNPVIDIRNNIFSNNQTTTGSGKNFAIGLGSTSFTNLTLDYNAYFVSGTLGQLAVTGGIGPVGTGIEYATLNAFRAATGKDANSVSKAVTFVSTTDAHLAGASIGDTSLRCLPIPGITRDIDNELRNTTFTYMGADEIVSNPLPVKLLAFNAQALSTNARVTWTTAAEVNNKGFELERSFDGKTFEFAQFIDGAGNSNKISNYQYIDAGILTKTPAVYYRLKQVDFNGRFEYSETVMVSKPKTSSNEVVVYPNPTSGIISLLINTDVEEHYEVTITDMNGKVVYNQQLLAQQGNNQIPLQKSEELILGIYFVRVTGQQQTKVIKLVKTN